MPDNSFLRWPFFDDRHRALAEAIERWSAANLPVDHDDVDAACRNLVEKLGRDGWLKSATKRAGTWWEAWADWAIGLAGDTGPAPASPGSSVHPALALAPGAYVRDKAPA